MFVSRKWPRWFDAICNSMPSALLNVKRDLTSACSISKAENLVQRPSAREPPFATRLMTPILLHL